MSKPDMRENSEAIMTAKAMLYKCFRAGLRMLYPMMPFITEEIFERLPGPNTTESIMIVPYTVLNSTRVFPEPENIFESVMSVAEAICLLKSEHGLKASISPGVCIVASDQVAAEKAIPEYVRTLYRAAKSLFVLLVPIPTDYMSRADCKQQIRATHGTCAG